MIQIEEKEIVKGIDEAYKKAGTNAYFGNGFQAGVDFALNRVKNLNIPSVVVPKGTLPNKYCPQCGEPVAKKHKFWCGK